MGSRAAYLYSLRVYILFVSLVFIGSIVIGYMGFLSDVLSESVEWIKELGENVKESTQEYPPWVTFLGFFIVIFLNNAFTCFFNATYPFSLMLLIPLSVIFVRLFSLSPMNICGVFLLPFFSPFINGGLLGWLAQEEGPFVFLVIVPHGIFELPAFLLSAAIGLRLGHEVLKRKGVQDLKEELQNGLVAFFTLILPLLLLAAFIESVFIVMALYLQ